MVSPCTRLPRPAGLPSEEEVLGRAAGENFPVAMRVLPEDIRRNLLAIYGYARFVDQLGDAYGGDRLAALSWLEAEVDAGMAESDGVHPLVARATGMVRETGADPKLLHDLIEANRRDQTVTRYATFDDLVDYCRYSANPVGRLVLATFAAASPDPARVPGLAGGPESLAQSDSICTGLQVAEHLQDVGEDAGAGRVYLPLRDLERFGVEPDSFVAGRPATSAQRALIGFQVSRARRLLEDGRPLAAGLSGWSRLAVSGFIAGGDAALDALAAANFDPLVHTPRPNPVRLAANLLHTWRYRPVAA